MLWWSSSDTTEAKVPENGIGETISEVQPATDASYGLPADRMLEFFNLPPEPSPAPTSPPAPIPSPASTKVVAEERTLSTQVERLDKQWLLQMIDERMSKMQEASRGWAATSKNDDSPATKVERLDKQWLLHMLDERMSKMQEQFNELQKSVDERFEAVESDAAQARSNISAGANTLKRLGLTCSNLEAEIKHTKEHTRSSVARLSSQGSPQVASNMMREVNAAVQFVQETTEERADELSRVQRNLNGFVRDAVRKLKQEVHTIDKKLINLSISASLFSLKVGEMSHWQRSHSLSSLQKRQVDMSNHCKLHIDDDSNDDPMEKLRFEEMLCQEPLSPTGSATQASLRSAESEIEQSVDESSFLATPDKYTSIEANTPATDELHIRDFEKSADRRGVDKQELQSMVEEIASNEVQNKLQGLDAKMTLLSLSSNLFCIKTFNLSKPVRARCSDQLERQLKALKAKAGHLGNLSCFTTSSDAALEALTSETRRLESSPDASSGAVVDGSTRNDAVLTSSQNASSDAAECGSTTKDRVLEEAARSQDVGKQLVRPQGESLSAGEDIVPPEVEKPVRMKYSTTPRPMMELLNSY